MGTIFPRLNGRLPSPEAMDPRRLVSRFSSERLLALGRRSRQVLLLSAVTGAVVGLGVTGFESLAQGAMLDNVRRLPAPLQAFAPLVGLVAAAACLRWLARGASPSTSDDYIKNFHDRETRLDERPVLGRVLAAAATLGTGGPLGFEGPSIYLGAAVGSGLQRRLSRFFSRDDAKVLLVAGAAAGVAAIFKAPATGVVFALEVPYQDDLAHRMLLPAAMSAATSYVVFVAFEGTRPLVPVLGAPPFNLLDLGGAALLGVLCGLGARVFVRALRAAKRGAAAGRPMAQAVAGGLTLAALFVASHALSGDGLTLGPGYDAVRWALDPGRSVWLVGAILLLRAAATVASVRGGGVGGLFVPLVVLGVFTGRLMGGVFQVSQTTLFPVIGIAAFLGAGYRVPLAAVTFVAEFTGRPGFVVPGLIAAVVAQLVMGRSSASPYQVASAGGHLERRFSMPLARALRTDVLTLPPDATVSDFFHHHLMTTRQRSVPVVEARQYLGMVRLVDLDAVAHDRWDDTPVSEIMRTDHPRGRVDWLLRDAIAEMERTDVDRLPILDEDGAFVGTVSTGDIIKLDEILGHVEGEAE